MSQKFDLRQVHVYQKARGSKSYVLKETHPAVLIAQESDKFYIQHGKVFDAGGTQIADRDLPEWFHERVRKMKPAAIAETGFTPRPEKPAVKA